MLKYCPDRNKTPKICDKAVDAGLSSLKFVPDWLVTSKIFEILEKIFQTGLHSISF